MTAAYGYGFATLTDSGDVLDTWFFEFDLGNANAGLLYTSPSPRDRG